jgi:hypothetical protein
MICGILQLGLLSVFIAPFYPVPTPSHLLATDAPRQKPFTAAADSSTATGSQGIITTISLSNVSAREVLRYSEGWVNGMEKNNEKKKKKLFQSNGANIRYHYYNRPCKHDENY